MRELTILTVRDSIGGLGVGGDLPTLDLHQAGVVLLRELMSPAAAASLAHDLLTRQARNELTPDTGVAGAWSAYADPIFQVLLLRTKPMLEALVGAELLPTYSYARIYDKGCDLPPHVDREACEVSVSLALGVDGAQVWPFWAEYNGSRYEIPLQAGDAALYLGHACRHWREPLPAAWSAHVFLHYVFTNGPFAKYQFDARP